MIYRIFKIWYNEHCDKGFWDSNDARKCSDIIEQMEYIPIHEREKKWIELEPITVNIVNDTNKKIKRFKDYI